MIDIQGLDFYYDRQQVLYSIDLHVPAGSVTGLVGANGAGKSTLMRCMAGLERPASGEVRFEGVPIFEDLRAYFRHVGYLPDLFGLPSGLTVLQCLAYAARSRGVSQSALSAAIEKTVNLLNLQDKINADVRQLSRGQKQRVGIGQIIISSPKFLLLDEPASGLDPEARHHLSLLIKQLQQEGMTLLVSSHILSELDEYCTHMLAINDGRILSYQALAEGASQQWVVIELDDVQSALATLRGWAEIVATKAHSHGVAVCIADGKNARQALITRLVGEGLSPSAIYVEKASLLESYQSSLRQKGGKA